MTTNFMAKQSQQILEKQLISQSNQAKTLFITHLLKEKGDTFTDPSQKKEWLSKSLTLFNRICQNATLYAIEGDYIRREIQRKLSELS